MTLDVARLQRRAVIVLSLGQVLNGIAFGATISLGALLAASLSGDDSLSGLATAFVTLGAAACAIPLARLALRKGRRVALTLGNTFALIGITTIITAAAIRSFPLLLLGVSLVGAGNAGSLQSRFAATDLAIPAKRGRDLSIVVWATTIGGVSGPFLLAPGEVIGSSIGMPPQTGAYVFSIVAQVIALVMYLIALRPDPLLTAQQLAAAPASVDSPIVPRSDRPGLARFAIFAVSGSHAVMASVMAMTPIHLHHMTHGDPLSLIGLTIGLHVFGMYGLSPVFGIMADRIGAIPVIVFGQIIFFGSLVTVVLFDTSAVGIVIALILLGLGWSAATVAGASLLTSASSLDRRQRRQGLSDSLMSVCGGFGAIGAGFVLGWIGYGGLAGVAMIVAAAIILLSFFVKNPKEELVTS